jgi:hypothetical protein
MASCRHLLLLLGCLLALLIIAATLAAADDGAEPGFIPGAAELSAVSFLASAHLALQELQELESPMERRLRCSTAIAALTGLYQLHGCTWVLPVLRSVYQHPDCPPMHMGYSLDGRFSLRVEPMELFNPAFDEYTVVLCTFESNTSIALTSESSGLLVIELSDGTQIEAQPLTPDHQLWEQLSSLAPTFTPANALPSGAGSAFKQLFAAKVMADADIQAVSLDWGAYALRVPYLEHAPPQVPE